MKVRLLTGLLALTLLPGCLSKSDPPEDHFFTLRLPALEGIAVPGKRPLRFDRVQSPPLLSNRMIWRVGENEVASDDQNAWAVHPADVLEYRLRDLLFSREGYRESLSVQDPLLSVRVVTMEGDLGRAGQASASARVEIVADMFAADGTQHRQHFEELEPLESEDPVGLSRALAKAVDRSSARLVEWVVERR